MAAQDIAAAPHDEGQLFGIGEAASRAGVSERALRYYQELGLIEPSGRTPGGMRRYSEANIGRVVRIRELQSLLALNLDEIKVVLGSEDRLERLREVYWAERPEGARRRELIEEGISLRRELVITIQTKLARLQEFLDGENAAIDRLRTMLAETAEPDDSADVRAPEPRP
jgi:MerR family transcriptional regulator, repressor of the yfmOP operon